MAAGIPPHIALDYTPRELFAVFAGRNISARRDHQLAIFEAWHVEAFARNKRLPKLQDLLRKMDEPKVMSPKAIRSTIIDVARAMGATVRYVKKGELH